MFTTRLQRFKRHPTLVTLEQNGKQHEKKKKKEKYVYIYISRSILRVKHALLCACHLSSKDRQQQSANKATRHEWPASSSFAFSAKCLQPRPHRCRFKFLRNFQLLSKSSPKYRTRKTRTTAYFPPCSPHFVSWRVRSAVWSETRCIRLCIPPHLSTPSGEILSRHLSFVFLLPACFVFSFARLPASLLNIAPSPIACYSVTNL